MFLILQLTLWLEILFRKIWRMYEYLLACHDVKENKDDNGRIQAFFSKRQINIAGNQRP